MAMAIYTRLKDLREDADKTQSDVARYLGTTAQYYGKYEKANANSLSTAQFGLLNTIMSHLTISPEEATTNSASRSPTMKPPS